MVLLSQRNSLAVRDLGPSRSQRVFPRRKAFTEVFLKSFPVRPCFRFVKAKPVFTRVGGGTKGLIFFIAPIPDGSDLFRYFINVCLTP